MVRLNYGKKNKNNQLMSVHIIYRLLLSSTLDFSLGLALCWSGLVLTQFRL